MKRLTDFEHLPLAVRCVVAAGLAAALCALAQLVSAGSAWHLLVWPTAAVCFAFGWYYAGCRWLRAVPVPGPWWPRRIPAMP